MKPRRGVNAWNGPFLRRGPGASFPVMAAKRSNRDRLVEASAVLFARNGYRATSLDDILQETGVSRSNFYYHFPGKADLGREVVDHWIRVYEEEIVGPALGNADEPPLRRVGLLFEAAADSQDPERGRVGSPLGRLAMELAGEDPAVRETFDGWVARLRDRIRWTVVEALPSGGDQFATRQIAAVTVAALEGALLVADLKQQPRHVREVGRALVALIQTLVDASHR